LSASLSLSLWFSLSSLRISPSPPRAAGGCSPNESPGRAASQLLRPLGPSKAGTAGRGRGPRGAARQRHQAQPAGGRAAELVRGAAVGQTGVVVDRVRGAAVELLEQALQHAQRRFA